MSVMSQKVLGSYYETGDVPTWKNCTTMNTGWAGITVGGRSIWMPGRRAIWRAFYIQMEEDKMARKALNLFEGHMHMP